jgi:signal recognition particle GTPase
MPTDSPYTIDIAIVDAAGRCEKGKECLDRGPKCSVTAELSGAEAVMVRCGEIGPCAYKTGSYHDGAMEVSLCSCPVRLEFYRNHGI